MAEHGQGLRQVQMMDSGHARHPAPLQAEEEGRIIEGHVDQVDIATVGQIRDDALGLRQEVQLSQQGVPSSRRNYPEWALRGSPRRWLGGDDHDVVPEPPQAGCEGRDIRRLPTPARRKLIGDETDAQGPRPSLRRAVGMRPSISQLGYDKSTPHAPSSLPSVPSRASSARLSAERRPR